MPVRSEWIPLTDAALLLGLAYNRALDRLLSGRIVGRRSASGRWEVLRASCVQPAEENAPAGNAA